MSLVSFYVQQVMLPSFYSSLSNPLAMNYKRQRESMERREIIIKTIRLHGGRMKMADLSAKLGWSTGTLRGLCKTLVDDGKLMRLDVDSGYKAYEVI